MAYFRIIENQTTKQFRWQLREDNHEVICHGESHPTEGNVLRAINALPSSLEEAMNVPMWHVIEGEPLAQVVGEDSP